MKKWLVILGGGLLLSGCIHSPAIKKEAGEENKSFTGKLKDAIAMGLPMKCTYKNGDMTGEGYIKGKQYYGLFNTQNGEGYVLMKDKCMWSWNKGNPQGVKTCFEEDVWDDEENTDNQQANVDTEYVCSAAVITDEMFTPPTDVNFFDASQMQQQMQQQYGVPSIPTAE